MKPAVAYPISALGGAALSAATTWLAGPDIVGAPAVTAVFGALFGAWIIGDALRGSFRYIREERTPLSARGRVIFGGIGVACVIGLPLLIALVHEPPR